MPVEKVQEVFDAFSPTLLEPDISTSILRVSDLNNPLPYIRVVVRVRFLFNAV